MSARATVTPRMPPPVRGRPYYDEARGRQMIVPHGGGKAIPYVGSDGPAGFDPKRALRRSGATAGSLGRELADDAANLAGDVAERQPFDMGAFGGFLISAGAALVGLLLLDLLLSERGSRATAGALGGIARGVSALADPAHPLFARTPPKPAATATGNQPASVTSAGPAGPAPTAVDGRVFPVGGRASFTNDFHAPRADTGTHGGTDIFAPRGTPVYAIEDGTLSRVGWNTLGGNRLWVNDWYYAHLDRYAPGVRDGAKVKAGQLIGYVGTTGNAVGTPPHLHLGYAPGGYAGAASWVNPFDLLERLMAGIR